MTFFANYYTNMTMLGCSLIYMLLLMIGILVQKKDAPTTKPLLVLIIMEIIILIGQMGQWYLYNLAITGKGNQLTGTIDGLLFVLDFTLMYFSLIVFYQFTRVHIIDMGHKQGIPISIPYRLTAFICTWGCFFSLLFAFSMCTKSIVYFDAAGLPVISNSLLYILLARSNIIIYVICAYFILKYRKVLGVYYCCILLFYLWIRFSVILFDVANGISFSYVLLAIEVFILYLGIDRRRTRDLLLQKSEIARQKNELSEKTTQIMISQIQPHFLYNTLSVIDYLVGKDPETAHRAINSFSDYLRVNMESLGSSLPVPFEKELDHTKSYLWIEQMRFPDILKVEYDIQTTSFRLPALTLQPLVENAVKHGVRGREEGGTVTISTYQDDTYYYVCVRDDGIGFDSLQEPSTDRIHIGIENARTRVEMICNGKLLISSSPGKGTTATIMIPAE